MISEIKNIQHDGYDIKMCVCKSSNLAIGPVMCRRNLCHIACPLT